MTPKTCLVTGGASGLGAATAEALASRGMQVVILDRDRANGDAVAHRIRHATGNSLVRCVVADLSSQADVRRAAAEFLAAHPRLDVLINNAGAIFLRRAVSVDGIEKTFAVNHLGHFLLTHCLLEVITASAPARIINISSIGHTVVKRLRFEDLQYRRRYGVGWNPYFHSKLAIVMSTYELAKRLDGTGVTVNALHPGVLESNFGRNNGRLWGFFKPLTDRLFRIKYIPAAEAARAVVFLATAPEVERVSGRYFDGMQPVSSSPGSQDQEAWARLWRISEEMTGVTPARRSTMATVPHGAPSHDRPAEEDQR